MSSRQIEPRPAEDLDIALPDLWIAQRLAELGFQGAEDRLQWYTPWGVSTGMVNTSFVTPDAASDAFRDLEVIGARVELPDIPYGYALVLLPIESANNAAAMMLSSTVDDLDDASTDLARSAVTELGGMMVNGFFDAWADRFGQEIMLAEPEPVHNSEREIIDQTIDGADTMGVHMGTQLALPEHDVTLIFYLFPDNTTYTELLARIEPGVVE